MKVFLSPSNQNANIFAVGNTNEQVQATIFADKIQGLLEKNNVTVVRDDATRPFDRINAAVNAGCDLYIPLHSNGFNGTVSGARYFCYRAKASSPALATKNIDIMTKIYDSVLQIGMNKTPLLYKDYTSWTELTNASNHDIPACYMESFFHDNVSDCNWWFANIDKYAEAVAKAICTYYGVVYKDPNAVTPTPIPQPVAPKSSNMEIYRVGTGWLNGRCVGQIGAFSVFDNAKNACIEGYKVFNSAGEVVYSHVMEKGSRVRVINPIIYGTNERFIVYFPEYTLKDNPVGDRAVIYHNDVCVAAISTSNLQLLS